MHACAPGSAARANTTVTPKRSPSLLTAGTAMAGKLRELTRNKPAAESTQGSGRMLSRSLLRCLVDPPRALVHALAEPACAICALFRCNAGGRVAFSCSGVVMVRAGETGDGAGGDAEPAFR